MNAEIYPSEIFGEIDCPPSKSVAHRLLIAAFLSGEKTVIENVSFSEDVKATIGAIKSLGAKLEVFDNSVALYGREKVASAKVFCNESGSTLRFLMPVASALKIKAEFDGLDGLKRRPIKDLVNSLNSHGAEISGLKLNGELKSGVFDINAGVSSQYISGLLFALPILDGDSEIRFIGKAVSKSYIEITIDVLNLFGIKIEKTENGFKIKGNQRYRSAKTVKVEGDYSNAAFFLAAGALGSGVTVNGLNEYSAQGDKNILKVLDGFGAKINRKGSSVTVSKGELKGQKVDVTDIPDLAQIISVVAAFSVGESVIRGVERLKLKESDRLKAITDMLTLSGIEWKLSDEELKIFGGRPHGGIFDGGNDHRTVMSCAILAAFTDSSSKITGIEAVNKSYPNFFDDFKKTGGKCDVDI